MAAVKLHNAQRHADAGAWACDDCRGMIDAALDGDRAAFRAAVKMAHSLAYGPPAVTVGGFHRHDAGEPVAAGGGITIEDAETRGAQIIRDHGIDSPVHVETARTLARDGAHAESAAFFIAAMSGVGGHGRRARYYDNAFNETQRANAAAASSSIQIQHLARELRT